MALVIAVTALAWPRMFTEPQARSGVDPMAGAPSAPRPGHQQATLGAGCFWCTEAVFQQIKGVDSVVSGYSGGHVKNPTYEEVCDGTTGHAEVVQVSFDPAVVTFAEILEVFWHTHDPTTLNRQGRDFGPQYRSAIFYHTDEQRAVAEEHKRKLDASGVFAKPIVTAIVSFAAFYPAEAHHQNFYLDHPRHGYCTVVIRPKLEKLQKILKGK